MYREASSGCELLLVHPGGPFWAKKDAGAWSIPKGEYEADENPLQAAIREFEEELGSAPPESGYRELGEIVQPSRKRLVAFAIEGDFDPATVKSNLFEMEWPPKERAACSPFRRSTARRGLRRTWHAQRSCRARPRSSIVSSMVFAGSPRVIDFAYRVGSKNFCLRSCKVYSGQRDFLAILGAVTLRAGWPADLPRWTISLLFRRAI